jgi:alcohol dehydrogenase (NADP+)
MHTLRLLDGTLMPALGLGTWLSEKDSVRTAVRHAIATGYRHIDAAAIYLNEAEVGAGIADAIADGHCAREDLWVTTKLWNDAHSPDDVRPALEASLERLGLDYVDLYLVHWPVAHRAGLRRPGTADDFLSIEQRPLAETWAAMARLAESELVRQVGVSNFNAAQITEITDAVGLPPAVDQIELHPYLAQPALLAFLREREIIATAYCPLGSGGRPRGMKREDEARLLADPVVTAVAAGLSATPAQVLIAWALDRGTAVIPKSTHSGRIEQNFAAATVELSDSDRAAIDGLDRAERYVTGAFWCPPGSPYTLEWLWGETP